MIKKGITLACATSIAATATITGITIAQASSVNATPATQTQKPQTAAQKKAEAHRKHVTTTKRKYGIWPLPTNEKNIKRYKLRKSHLKQIKKSNKWAKTRKARSVIRCESGGNYKINTGNGYYGAWQFNRGTWLGNGGGKYAKYAHKAPKFAQNHIAWKTWKSRGWQPWACA